MSLTGTSCWARIPPAMTLEQFRSNLRVYQKYEWISAGCFMAGVVTMTGVGSLVAQRVKEVGFDALSIVVLLAAFIGIVALMGYGAVRYPNRRMRELGLLCPSCKKQLITFGSQVVIATGRCGYCGEKVLESN